MAVITRRPTLALGFALLLYTMTACSLMQSEEPPTAGPDQAARMVREGQHAAAAQSYADLAREVPADHDNYALLSAEQWLAAGNLAAARQTFATVSPGARTTLPASRALVAAEIAYAENDPVRTLRELDQIPVPNAADQAQNYWWLRGRSDFLTARPVEGTRALVERERYLADPSSLRANREELLTRIRSAAEHGQSLKPPAQTDPVVAGWLALGAVSVELARDPLRATGDLANWRRTFPQHPANTGVLTLAQTQIAAAGAFPDQIALLLPLSGRAEASGVAVRDGFIAAYLDQDAATRPRLKIYDVAAETVGSAYARAVSEGAGFIVGPLTKEDVAAVVPLAAGRMPVLALNFLGGAVNTPKNFYQFALLPEDEARSVARRVVADGRLNGVMLVPSGEWGSRIAAAFADELGRLGGSVVGQQRYEPSQVDFSDAIKQVLQVKGVKGEPSTHRGDAAFIFIAGTPAAARLIMPQLKFHYAGDVPAYSTSDSFEPDAGANADIDGLLFPDMPWMISNDTVTAQIRDSVRDAWPARTARRDRLYAFGFDAYRLVPTLRGGGGTAGEIAGVTGKLHLDEENRIRRDLDWAQIKSGVPSLL
jgi:outer membrane PBP1 activator LpoA protein